MTSRRLDQDLTDRLYWSFREARKRKLGTFNEFKFEMDFAPNLAQLKKDIIDRTYHPSRGIAFITDKPVIREIFAAPFRDRVVHHLIISYVGDWWDRRFIHDSYSCRDDKGTDHGVRRFYHHIRAASENFTKPAYVFKFDIQGYFTSLPRDRIYERALWGLERQFLYDGHNSYDEELYDMLSFLWREVIFDDPIKNVTIRGRPELWAKLPKRKSLFHQVPGTGIVIGNLTSQVISNIYLDQLDRFITLTLGYKHYGRYVDDFFVIVPGEGVERFKKSAIPQIEAFITGLGLKLHPDKQSCQPIERGTAFLGAKIYPYRVLPGERLIKNYRRDAPLIANGLLSQESLISYRGRCSHFKSQHIEKKIWGSVGWDYRPTPRDASSQYYTDPKSYNRQKG